MLYAKPIVLSFTPEELDGLLKPMAICLYSGTISYSTTGGCSHTFNYTSQPVTGCPKNKIVSIPITP